MTPPTKIIQEAWGGYAFLGEESKPETINTVEYFSDISVRDFFCDRWSSATMCHSIGLLSLYSGYHKEGSPTV